MLSLFQKSKLKRRATILFILLFAYPIWWAIWYRLPPDAPLTIDLRKEKTDQPFYLTFCAGLASNFHGFPGHAYVNWSTSKDAPIEPANSIGYIPQKYNDQFIAPFASVPGMLHIDAKNYNQRNLDTLTVIVDGATYKHSLKARNQWNTADFKASTHDCVSFSKYIAKDIGLVVPEGNSKFPQDHLKALKELNAP